MVLRKSVFTGGGAHNNFKRCCKEVRKLNWIAEPELSLLSNVTFIILILVVFPQSVKTSTKVLQMRELTQKIEC